MTTAPEGATADVVPRWGLPEVGIGFVVAFLLVNLLAPVVYAVTGVPLGTDDDVAPLRTIALRQVPYYAGFLSTALFVTSKRGNGPARDLGLRFRAIDPVIGVPAGIAAQIGGLLLYLPVFWLTDITSSDLDKPARQLADKATGTGGVVVLVLVVAVAAPLVEEIFFRGLMLRAFERRLGTTPAVVVTALLFGLSHFQFLQLPALFLFGVVAGVLTVRTGRLGPAMAAHCAFNAVAVVALLA